MSIHNVKTFTKVGPSDVFLLDPNGTYTVTTLGAGGAQSDALVYEADNDLASAADALLTTNWVQLADTASADLTDQAITGGTKKLVFDVQTPLVDGGITVTLKQTGALAGAFDKSQGLLSANNQRQKFSSAVRVGP